MTILYSLVPKLRSAAYAGGIILCIASLAFVAWAFSAQLDRIGELGAIKLDLGQVALAAALYATSLVTTAIAWPILVEAPRVSFGRLLAIGLASQVAKYVPGNFANYLGRALIAQRHEIGLKRGLGTTMIELGSAIVAGMVVGMISIAESDAAASIVSRHASQLQMLSAGVLVVFILFAKQGRSAISLAGSTLVFMGSFLLAGASFYVLSNAFDGQPALDPTFAVAAYAFAWIAGFIVVGAPAGLGVREAILVGLLAPTQGMQLAIVLAALHRLITIGVDLIMGLGASYALWGWRGPKHDD